MANSNFSGAFSDRLIPGTEAFNLKQQEIINSQAPGFGAAIFDQSRLYHGDARMKVRKGDDFFESFIVGANVRVYAPDSRGTVFTDSTGNELRNFEYGLFTELSKKLDDRTTASGSIRYDKMRVLKPKQASDYLL